MTRRSINIPKIQISSISFLRYRKVVILGTLGMPHQTQQNQLEENFYVYLPEKISF